ncbi:hypothetical protein DFH01_14455 [Falsiroseomonas bella]|uniref:Ice-binding protein C-terminal domain-containing protein n=1 Tax=Falsiroseomonas bella TaxID=2184016 RepID=A0A317FEK2_9PROT|nr:PEP-CTERM sorting domain-containing protein [Falsiroseomonas bella]PWS36369.1 hypothetical protein DFH01_14455 [Falsiroseomonas bella]
MHDGKLALLLATSLALAPPLPAEAASLVGTSVTATDTFWTVGPAATAVVGNGIEFTLSLFGVDGFTVDVTADAIVMTGIYSLADPHNLTSPFLLTVGDLNFGPGLVITGVNFSTSQTIGGLLGSDGLVASDVSFTTDSVSLNYNFVSWPRGASVTLTFDLGPAATVPEPASLMLLGFGLAGLAATRRRSHPAGA